MVGGAVVVAPHQRLIIGIRANHCHFLLVLCQGQHIALVLKEHDGLTSHVKCYLTMLLAVHF